MSLFEDFDRLRPHVEQALALARQVAVDRNANLQVKQTLLGMLVVGVADVSRELQPDGAAEKLLRDIGAKKPGASP
jgi:hypothetical protein